MPGIDGDRAKQRAVTVELERRATDDAMTVSGDERVIEVFAKAGQRQVLALEQRFHHIDVTRRGRTDDDRRHACPFVTGAQHARPAAAVATGTQHPVRFSNLAASLRSDSTCPSA